MSDSADSNDKSFEALDFLINVLKEHEQILDKWADSLSQITENASGENPLNDRIDKIGEKIDILQKEVTDLISSAIVKETPITTVPATIKLPGNQLITLICNRWEDFQASAKQSQMIAFNYEEQTKVFHFEALKANLIIKYTSSEPNLASILKSWLSWRLETREQNIFEGSLSKSK